MSADDHRDAAPAVVRFAVLTVSDTRTPETDRSGALVLELVQAAAHVVSVRAICRDEPADVARLVREACHRDDVDLVVLSGGTGLSARDSTFEAISELYERPIPGFGELFRMLSFAEIGAAAMLSRASAGIVGGKAVFSLPGSPPAVRLAVTRLILPEAGHLMTQLAG